MTTVLEPTDTGQTADPEVDVHPDQERADAIAAGLRQLADMITASPELIDCFRYAVGNIVAPLCMGEREAEALAALARSTLRHGGSATKWARDDKYFDLYSHFGPVRVQYIADRDQVCERVVVGTREVTEEVPDPDAPKVTVTKTVEDVEWKCRPLLTDETDGGAA